MFTITATTAARTTAITPNNEQPGHGSDWDRDKQHRRARHELPRYHDPADRTMDPATSSASPRCVCSSLRQASLIISAVTWPLAAFVLLFPLPAVRRFYAIQLPQGAITLLIAALGAAALVGFWVLARRHGRGPAKVARE